MSGPGRWLLSQIQGAPEPGERQGRLMMTAGHYMLIPTAMWAAYSIGEALAGSPGGPVGWGQQVLFAVSATCFYCDLRWHGTRLCEKCARATPLDPQRAVRRWKPALRFVHEMRDRKSVLAVILIVALAPVFMPSGGVSTGIYVGVTVVVMAMWVSMWRHSCLQPWCPWCNWGKGGDEEVSPEVPDPALSK
jgi:hypothetical protein